MYRAYADSGRVPKFIGSGLAPVGKQEINKLFTRVNKLHLVILSTANHVRR